MSVIKSAIKKLRRDKKREKENNAFRKMLDSAIRAAKKQKSGKTVSKAVSLIDRAVKKNLMHKNRAARIKSALSKLARPEHSRAAKPIAKSAKVTKPKPPAKSKAKK